VVSDQLSALSFRLKTEALRERPTVVLHSFTVSVSMRGCACKLMILDWFLATQFHSPFSAFFVGVAEPPAGRGSGIRKARDERAGGGGGCYGGQLPVPGFLQ